MKQYQASGFIQNVIEQPAEDATREWIDITTNRDDDLKINRMIEKRLDDLGVQKKMKDFIKFSRMYEKGSMLYYGVIADVPQTDDILTRPLNLRALQEIDFINVIEEPDRFYFFILNRYDPTKSDYNKVEFYIMGRHVHESRLSWICYNWYPMEMMGVSVIETIEDATVAQNNALWSVSSLLSDIATTTFKSHLIESLPPDKQAELAMILKHRKNTQSVMLLGPTDEYQKLTYSLNGIKDLFEFTKENLSCVSRMPLSILYGRSHGIVTAQEYEAIGYYNNIAKFQENELRPIIKQIIDMIIWEQRGEIYQALGGGVDQLDYDFTFKPLYRLDPMSQATKELNDSNRDKIDIESGKISPNEARTLDPRMDELEDFSAGQQPYIPGEEKQYANPTQEINQRDITKVQLDPAAMDQKAQSEGAVKPKTMTNYGFRTAPDHVEEGEAI
jgi:phage-related protein (TIGR01555 family)